MKTRPCTSVKESTIGSEIEKLSVETIAPGPRKSAVPRSVGVYKGRPRTVSTADFGSEIIEPERDELDGLRLQAQRILGRAAPGAKNPLEVRIRFDRRNELLRLNIAILQFDEDFSLLGIGGRIEIAKRWICRGQRPIAERSLANAGDPHGVRAANRETWVGV